MSEFVNEKTGAISQHELALSFLENAPTIELGAIKKEVLKYFKTNGGKYHLLNSKLVNYIQIFDVENAEVGMKASHFMDFISESGFVANSKGSLAVIIEEDAVYTPMTDIRDIEFNTENGTLEMYIGATYFTLSPADTLIEKTIEVMEEN